MAVHSRKRVIMGWERLCSRVPVLPWLYLKRYDPMVSREIDLAEIGPEDTVVQIGCGSAPATAALIARKTAASVVALDHDETAVANARRFLDRIGLGIPVREADGRAIDTGEFTVAVVALHTIGKERILDNFLAAGDSSDRAVLRYPRAALATTYGKPGEQYQPEATVEQVGVNLDRSVLFRPSP